MSFGLRLGFVLLAAAVIGLPAAPSASQQAAATQETRADFDIRDGRPAVAARATSDDGAPRRAQGTRRERPRRVNRESGTVRVLDRPGLSAARRSPNAVLRALLAANARRLGLARRDLGSLTLVRDYTSRSNGVRHLTFRQTVDGMPVFDSAITVHLLADGTIARITSNAASIEGRTSTLTLTAARARAEAAGHVGNSVDAAAPASLTWLPVDGVLRLAWQVAVPALEGSDLYDILIDAQNGELLLRRNRALYAEGFGRVLQGPGTASLDPRLPDPMPFGADGTLACPPPVNYALRSLNSQFRDPATVLASTGLLEGNATRVFRGNGGQAAEGTFDGSAWQFDFAFNSAGSAETYLFFAMNFAHDFFYDLGFDEAAGNFQVDNFGRGGLGGDPLRAKARAAGRNNANYVHAPDGSSPTINMFLWDGAGCWAQDVDGDGFTDIDGDYDLDIILHEYHHGVSHRLNTAFSGNEAGAIGEGGSDFFAYSVNNDSTLAEYSRPGGLRRVNSKGYGDWTCLQGLFCEVHDNGEIFVNALWDLRERFRADLVRGSNAAAINESHQLYVDALALSPPRPTMLDMRDAILEADAIRNPGSPSSENFCRIWESFGGRGMGESATDTADNGGNRVGPAYDVPDGCQAPPTPLLVTITATTPTALEAGPSSGAVTISRSQVSDSPLTVNYAASGTAVAGSDYVALSGNATIPAGAADVVVPITPIDDSAVENNEAVNIALASGTGYAIGAPSFATVTIVSDDVQPDLIVSALTSSQKGGAGGTIQVTDTTRNQGTGAAGPSETFFYLSRNGTLESTDQFLGSRGVGDLPAGSAGAGSVSLVLPDPLESGTYYLFAKADGLEAVVERIEYNNLRTTTIAVGPDLTLSSLTAPPAAAAGGSILISDTTANQGGGAAPASSTRFFLSVNLFLDASDTPLQPPRDVGALGMGASSPGSTTVTIPPGMATGTYYLIGQADTGGIIVEPNELNNTRSTIVRIGADLTVSAMSAPTRAAAGAPIAVTDTTRNLGAGAAGASTTALYLSTNLSLDASDIRLQPSRSVLGLGANEFSTGTTTVTLPDVAAGTWFLLANADDGNAVPETQELNNVRWTTLQIGPDLTFVTVSAPSSGVSGTPITVSDTVRNIGAADAPATIVRYYLSTNSVLDAADVQLNATRSVPALAAGASNAGSTSVPLPSGMTGSFYLIVVADGGQAVGESSEQNNNYPRLIQISAGT